MIPGDDRANTVTVPQMALSEPSVHFSSESVEWATPQWLFDALNKEFGFTVDVCSSVKNFKCCKHYTRETNGLMKSWAGEVAWMNPPYGDEVAQWMAKAFGAALYEGATGRVSRPGPHRHGMVA